MIATEDDAKKKWWCTQDRNHKCLAASCAAWRWYALSTPDSNSQPVGYCGVAGKPIKEIAEGIYF